ncbi:MAG TPA: hypothetical protein VL993_08640 [Stellaceae bacterium]|nr:hypothetical protein [Stellaceae bacterium]
MSVNANEMKVVRQRMRHLARLNIKPKPMVRTTGPAMVAEPTSDEARERIARLALRVLAVQMENSQKISALD